MQYNDVGEEEKRQRATEKNMYFLRVSSTITFCVTQTDYMFVIFAHQQVDVLFRAIVEF